MKVWQVVDDSGSVVYSIPLSKVLDPVAAAKGRDGYGVYEALDARGQILYTGRTKNLSERLRTHMHGSAWWGEARSIRWVACKDYGEVVALERVGISTDLGPWNQSGRATLKDGRMHLPESAVHRLVRLYAITDVVGPYDFDSYVATLRHAGWTLQSIATPLNITRERIRQRAALGAVDFDLVVPRPPAKAPRFKRLKPVMSDATVQRLLSLKRDAEQVRGWTPTDSPLRVASEQYSELLAEAHLSGVSIYRIAKQMGVTHLAIRARLARHGYTEEVKGLPQSKYGTPFVRHTGFQGDHCKRGHDVTSVENIRLINGDPKRRICVACERIRVQRYRDKKRSSVA